MWKMSDVRLSNGSPPLERVEPRVTDHSRPPLRRNLFGSADPEESRRVFSEQMREMERASAARWNYDFVRDEPLSPGQYEWEVVDSRDVPAFYTREPHSSTTRASNVDHNGNSGGLLTVPPSLENEGGDSETSGNRSDCRDTQSRKRPSTEDQDSASQSKRSNSEEDANHCPDASSSVEQTPKKSEPET